VAARGGWAILQVQPAAERLLRSLAVVHSDGAETALLEGAAPPEFDLECPLMSLPAVFETACGHGTLAGRLPGRGIGSCAQETTTVPKRLAWTGGAARGVGLGGESALQGGHALHDAEVVGQVVDGVQRA
jgi:hypothetical protein